MNNLIAFINNIITIEKNTIEALTNLCIQKTYQKGDFLQKPNGYCNYLFCINNGLVKLSFDTGDNEFVMRFFQEDVLFTELESLTENIPSKYQIIALETVHCTLLPYKEFEKLSAKNTRLALFFSKFLTRAHVNMMNRISEMLEADAHIRYTNFLKRHPDIIHRISLGDLSRYLGINQVTLSRIRSKK